MPGFRSSTQAARRWTSALALAWPTALIAQSAPVVLPALTVEAERPGIDGTGVVIRAPVDPLTTPDLAELLATLPGVQIRSSGGLGSYSEASLRGSSGRQVRVLLDGLPLDTGGGEAASLSQISPLLLEAAEVHKGRVPLGLDAGLAGTIHLRSYALLPAPLRVGTRVGSFGERQLHVAAQPTERLQFAAGTQRVDNDFLYRNLFTAFDPSNPDRSRREHRRNADTEQHYAYARFRGPLLISAHLVDDTQALPNRGNLPSQTELATRSYALALSSPPSAQWQAALSHRRTEERYTDPGARLSLSAQQTRDDTDRTLLRLGRSLDDWEFAVVADREHYRSRDFLGMRDAVDARRTGASGAMQWRAGRRWHFDAGLQLGWNRDEVDDRSRDDWRVEPAIGLGRRIGDCIATVNLGHRERLPTFFERYGDRGLFKGNPGLEPERALYADAGTRCVLDGDTRLELTAFGQDLRDAISPTYNGQGIGRSINTERATIVGLEAAAGGAIAPWQWQLSATWQDSEDRSSIRASRGKQLPGRYEYQFNASLERDWLGLRWRYAFRYEHGQFYDTPNLLKAAPVRRHDIGVRGAFARVGWSLQWLNLRDDNFEQFNGFPTPGRRLLLALSWPDPASTPQDRREP